MSPRAGLAAQLNVDVACVHCVQGAVEGGCPVTTTAWLVGFVSLGSLSLSLFLSVRARVSEIRVCVLSRASVMCTCHCVYEGTAQICKSDRV